MTSKSEVIPERVLGTMNDPLRLRADIDVALRNTCTISVTIELEGVVLGTTARCAAAGPLPSGNAPARRADRGLGLRAR